MNKQEYWNAHVKKNPKFADEEARIELSVKMLRRLMEEAYDKGFEHHKLGSEKFADMLNSVIGKRTF